MNTEGDLVKTAYASSYSNFIHPPHMPWKPFSEPVLFYNPEEHVDVFLALRDAPVQSCEKIESMRAEDEKKE